MKTKIFVAAALLIMALCLSSDTRISQAAAPTFNTTYVKDKGDYFKIKRVNPKKIQFYSYDYDFLSVNKKKNKLWVSDDYHLQGGLSSIDYKYGQKHYKTLVGYGNLIPFDFVVKKGNKKNFFNPITKKLLTKKNIKFTTSNPSIATVTSKGVVTGKKYGSTIVTVKWKKHIGHCKVFVLPRGLKKQQIDQGYMNTYKYLNKGFKSKKDYKYYINKKAFQEINSSFLGNLGVFRTMQSPLNFTIAKKRTKQSKALNRLCALATYTPNFNSIMIKENALILDVTIHQLGHFIDHYNAPIGNYFLTQTPKYVEYYKNYKKQFNNIPTAFVQSPQEYFAEAYTLYIISPFYMKKHLPNTYKWMNDFMRTHGYI